MLDIHSLLQKLKRPRLLVQAGRFGIDSFRRETDLHRVLETDEAPRPAEAIVQLMDVEAELNSQRISKAPDYSMSRHIVTLTAIMTEAQYLSRSQERSM